MNASELSISDFRGKLQIGELKRKWSDFAAISFGQAEPEWLNPRSTSFFAFRVALRARAHLPQKRPGVDAQFVPVVPVELDGVFPDTLSRQRLGGRFEHRQGTGSKFRRLAGSALVFATLLFAESTRARIAEKHERIT